ncbi:hypothetical protein [Streptomyces griseoflavus]|uniref:hypothetical protein n=1 Tax=Streptomyces griseoflavus TaxID=35619 RepID=UPI00167EFCD8|nr:hypothetical protein [Streptomyces griseoflavus]GGV40686.1 hypothetical protein GCM10010293_46140 [Streptomyces griseoflavus]
MTAADARPDAAAAGRRVEEVLDRLATSADRAAREAAEELVRALMEFYGGGFARTMELLGRRADRPAHEAVDALLRDELVAGLLVLHGLHPHDAPTRIARALDALPHAVENTGFDPATGELRLRLTGSGGCGRGGSRDAVEQAVRDTLAGVAPEVTAVTLEPDAAPGPVLLQIGAGPPGAPPSGPSGRPPATTAP